MVYWLSLIYFSLKTPLKSQTVNLKPNECLAVLKNNKGYHRQIRRVEKFMEDEMHVASSGWGNSNRTTTQTMWRARPWQSMSCCSQQGIEDIPSHRVSWSGLLRVTSQRTAKGRARPCCLPESGVIPGLKQTMSVKPVWKLQNVFKYNIFLGNISISYNFYFWE